MADRGDGVRDRIGIVGFGLFGIVGFGLFGIVGFGLFGIVGSGRVYS